MTHSLASLKSEIDRCGICADRFSKTHTRHSPRPVFWAGKGARILIAGQAPGLRVHESGRPFDDRSGDRLRAWLGVSHDEFYDQSQFAILPMAFCFPGYDAKGSDLPPPAICAKTWRHGAMARLGKPKLTLLIGRYAQDWHLTKSAHKTVTENVSDWRAFAPTIFPLPHPSWRNTGWVKKNPWFEAELLPALKLQVRRAMRQVKGDTDDSA